VLVFWGEGEHAVFWGGGMLSVLVVWMDMFGMLAHDCVDGYFAYQ
jgi:hypothetical protein